MYRRQAEQWQPPGALSPPVDPLQPRESLVVPPASAAPVLGSTAALPAHGQQADLMARLHAQACLASRLAAGDCDTVECVAREFDVCRADVERWYRDWHSAAQGPLRGGPSRPSALGGARSASGSTRPLPSSPPSGDAAWLVWDRERYMRRADAERQRRHTLWAQRDQHVPYPPETPAEEARQQSWDAAEYWLLLARRLEVSGAVAVNNVAAEMRLQPADVRLWWGIWRDAMHGPRPDGVRWRNWGTQ